MPFVFKDGFIYPAELMQRFKRIQVKKEVVNCSTLGQDSAVYTWVLTVILDSGRILPGLQLFP